VEDVEYDWEYSVYGHVSELIAKKSAFKVLSREA